MPALDHTKSSISNHTIREFNNQSWVTYISLFMHPIQISTVQSEEQHVVKHLPKFHLNRTVNEAGNAVLWKLRRLEKSVAPGGMKLASGGCCSTKSTKNSVFRESEHHT